MSQSAESQSDVSNVPRATDFESRACSDGRYTVLCKHTGKSHVLTAAEAALLESIDGKHTVAELSLKLAKSDHRLEDVPATLRKFLSLDLLLQSSMPAANPDLIMESVGEETVVYVPERGEACCLNQAASLVLRSCDGESSIDEISQTLKDELNLENGYEVLASTLEDFRERGLIPSNTALPTGLSRRNFLKGAGAAAAVLPALLPIAIPTPAEAASCVSSSACTLAANCGTPCGTCVNRVCGQFSITYLNQGEIFTTSQAGCYPIGTAVFLNDCLATCNAVGSYVCCINAPVDNIPLNGTGCQYCPGVDSSNLCYSGNNGCVNNVCT